MKKLTILLVSVLLFAACNKEENGEINDEHLKSIIIGKWEYKGCYIEYKDNLEKVNINDSFLDGSYYYVFTNEKLSFDAGKNYNMDFVGPRYYKIHNSILHLSFDKNFDSINTVVEQEAIIYINKNHIVLKGEGRDLANRDYYIYTRLNK